MTGKYDDIIHLPRHVSKKHPQMKAIDRAAQFSPFAALTGHGAAVRETARLTDKRTELDEYMKDELNHKLQIAEERLMEHPEIEITYFRPDERKKGGAYVSAIGSIKKIDEYEHTVIMNDGTLVPIKDIVRIEGDMFGNMVFRSCDE